MKKPEFNHAMVYVNDFERCRRFYVEDLGFEVLEEMPGAYVRLLAGSNTTIALHKAERGVSGIRLYFESASLDRLCTELWKKGVRFDKPPTDMPWGWRHAYLRDPDGHEISLFRAGEKRLRRQERPPKPSKKNR